MKKGASVWIRWSASDCYQVEFVKWIRMRRGCGGPDTNKIGVGAMIYSSWLFRSFMTNRKQRYGLKEGFYKIHPYHDLYRKDPQRNPEIVVRRPKLENVKVRIN